MREIKFRAWDCVLDKWVKANDVNTLFINLVYDKNYDVEQYTGLKDKNGVEIYEGDIVEWQDAPGMISTTGAVIFNTDRGSWYIENDMDNIYDELYNVFDYSEVISNIHEETTDEN